MNPLSTDGGQVGEPARPGDRGIVEVLRDILLLLAAIGVSLFAILALSLALPGEPPSMRIGSRVPTAPPGQEHAAPLAPGQVMAFAERSKPAWRVAAQE